MFVEQFWQVVECHDKTFFGLFPNAVTDSIRAFTPGIAICSGIKGLTSAAL